MATPSDRRPPRRDGEEARGYHEARSSTAPGPRYVYRYAIGDERSRSRVATAARRRARRLGGRSRSTSTGPIADGSGIALDGLRHLRAARRDLHATRARSTRSSRTSTICATSGITAIELHADRRSFPARATGATTACTRRRAVVVRRRRRPAPPRRRLPRARPGRRARRRLQPPRPRGELLGEYGPYFTDRYSTPWGDALNFDGPGSRRRALLLHRERAAVGRRLPHRRPARRRRPRHRRSTARIRSWKRCIDAVHGAREQVGPPHLADRRERRSTIRA